MDGDQGYISKLVHNVYNEARVNNSCTPGRDLHVGVFALLQPIGYTNLKNNGLMQFLLYDEKTFPKN